MTLTVEALHRWFAERVPGEWLAGPLEVMADDDEILVVCPLRQPAAAPAGEAPGGREAAEAETATRIAEFRADTKEQRMAIARQAERLFRRRVSWGARVGSTRELFTTLSVPVMTRLRLPDRALLDTLIESGVARSRSDAVAWCVRLVGTHEADWVEQLRAALVDVRRVRHQGPEVA